STNYPPQREIRHNSGIGAQWTKQHGGGKVVYIETYDTLARAMRREIQVKKWSRKKKENLISGKWKQI
ncbi:MAG: GIY-YIG nuclease family protein, partial [Patescibacteria group bacterium]